MLLAVDIGNTSIKFGVFDGDEIVSTHIIPTIRENTAAEIAASVDEWLPTGLTAAMISSVVPELDEPIAEYLETRAESLSIVRTTDDFGLTYNFPIDEAGTDRLVNASAAASLYGVPCIVIAFGTATTIDAVSREREHLGGLIAPGPATTARALELAASKLPEVTIAEPPNVIATNTEHAIQAGIFYSQIGLVERAVPDIKKQIGTDARVVATGGFAQLIADKCRGIDVIDRDLTLKGLKLLRSRMAQPA
jgi:type III pantothenate kinase